jgi:hypothetical protein
MPTKDSAAMALDETGDPVQVIWGILTSPDDEASLLALPNDDGGFAVLLFTQPELADKFNTEHQTLPRGSFVRPVEVLQLTSILSEKIKDGCTLVYTDAFVGASNPHVDKHTTITEYIAKLTG